MLNRPRILVLRGGAIGDFMLTLPALAALRANWPEAHIELIGYPHIARLAVEAGLAAGVHSLDRAGMARFFAPVPRLEETQRRFVRSFDLVLSYLHDPYGVVRANLLSTGVAQVLYRSPRDPEGHAVDHLLKPLEELAIYASGARPQLPWPAERCAAGAAWRDARGLAPRAVALHPGSGGAAKRWPLEQYLAVAREATGFARPFFLLGEADADLAPAVHTAGVPVLENADLTTVASVLSGCGGYLGNDAGITHLAAALDVPTVALFGPTDPATWAPRGPRVRVLRAPGGDLARLEVDPVIAALRQASG